MSLIAWTANLQHGEGTDLVTSHQRQIDTLGDGDLIGVQEKGTSDTGWNTPMSNAGLTQAVYRENDPTTGDGSAIWYKSSKVTILQTYQKDLSQNAIGWNGSTNVDKSAVGAKCSSEGIDFYFVVTHLAWFAGDDGDGSAYSAIRVAQIKTLFSWIEDEMKGHDVLLTGDMNLAPDNNFLKTPYGKQHDLFLAAGYQDLWTEGITQSKAIANWGDRNGDSNPDMPIDHVLSRTRSVNRFDYFFLKTVSRALVLNEIELPDLRANCSGSLVAGGNYPHCPDVESSQRFDTPDDFGVRPSDHNWVKLTVDLNPKAVSPVMDSQFSWFPNG